MSCIAYNSNNTRCKNLSSSNKEWPHSSLCPIHYNNLTKEDRVLFVHTTSVKNINQILRDNELRSYRATSNAGIGEGDSIMNPDYVFLTILFDYYRMAIPDYESNVFLFFDKSILEKNTPSHYCNRWEWGNITDECLVYNSSKSIDEWRKMYKKSRSVFKNPQNYIYGPQRNFSGVSNEVIFLNKVKFDSLVGIYCKDAGAIDPKHPLLMTTQNQLKNFLNGYGIMDVDTRPERNYYIDYDIEWDDERHQQEQDRWLNWASKQDYKSPELIKWKENYLVRANKI